MEFSLDMCAADDVQFMNWRVRAYRVVEADPQIDYDGWGSLVRGGDNDRQAKRKKAGEER